MASMHTETTDIMAGLQPPIQSAIIWTRTAIIADENVIAVEYRPIMEPILLEKQLRMKAGMVAFKQPVPTPMRAVPVKRPKTPRLERSTTPMATRQRFQGTVVFQEQAARRYPLEHAWKTISELWRLWPTTFYFFVNFALILSLRCIIVISYADGSMNSF